MPVLLGDYLTLSCSSESLNVDWFLNDTLLSTNTTRMLVVPASLWCWDCTHAGEGQIVVHLNDSMFTPEVRNCIKNLVVVKHNFGRGAWKAKELKY